MPPLAKDMMYLTSAAGSRAKAANIRAGTRVDYAVLPQAISWVMARLTERNCSAIFAADELSTQARLV